MRQINRTHLILALILILGGLLRFYKLDWGQGLFTHPDEYHLVISANQLSFPAQMNPHFFSYGTVTIYLMYFTKAFLSSLYSNFANLNYFLVGRFYSALFSTLTIFLVYKISRKFLPEGYALLAATLTALTPGLIQQAHFATPESNLIFFLLASLYFLLKFTGTPDSHISRFSQISFLSLSPIALASIFLGLALGVKVSGAFFGITLALAIILKYRPKSSKMILGLVLSVIITGLILFAVDPYLFLDFPHFLSSFKYESSLAAGSLPVFYTRQFIGTTPVIFQLTKIYPFALGLPLLLFGFLGFFLIIYSIFKSKSVSLTTYPMLLITGFLSLFLPNAFLFAKWTRFVAPTFPFFAIFAAFFLYKLSQLKIHKHFSLILNSSFLILNSVLLLAFFSIYINQDVRTTASNWLLSHANPNSTFFVEEGNMVDLPLEGNFRRVSANFYNYENNSQVQFQVIDDLQTADYIIIESRRIFLDHNPKKFPKTAAFYQALFSGQLGFSKIKEFTSYPTISLLGYKIEFPDETAEETWSVFDHPVIRVFKKVDILKGLKNGQLLEN